MMPSSCWRTSTGTSRPGLSPLQATLKGAGEIGFTILSISISLVAVFIPLLLMGGIIGRLFREFAITMTMTIAVSAFVALTLSPTMCALFLRDEKHAQARQALHGHRARLRSAAGGLYARPGFRAGPQARDADHVSAHPGGDRGCCTSTYPRASFRSRTPASSRGSPMRRRTSPSTRWCAGSMLITRCRGSAIRMSPAIGTGIGGNRPINNGFVMLGLKPRSERSASADQIINRLRPQLAKVPGIHAVPAGRAGSQCRRPHLAHAVSIHAAGFGYQRTQRLGAEAARRRCRSCPCCATSPPISRPAAACCR